MVSLQSNKEYKSNWKIKCVPEKCEGLSLIRGSLPRPLLPGNCRDVTGSCVGDAAGDEILTGQQKTLRSLPPGCYGAATWELR
ncbi:hypothetical protein JOB18_010642 [Solea senegalensis]|uniref:Uncharacterized protein n=1 Tax=Solea senegalensis TaxID=28829 RepID=A0AAV6RMU8_SOLSE|nr:hypothetical protein JOB18_010642 [Solea senegalensis]